MNRSPTPAANPTTAANPTKPIDSGANANPHLHLRWPCERFYWSLLDTSILPAGERPTLERLHYLLEPDLPEPLEDVHAVFARVDKVRFIGCALPRRRLQAEVSAGVLTLAPREFPEFVRNGAKDAEALVDPAALNLLVGEFEPASVKAWRRRFFAGMVVAAALLVGLTLVGIERRAASAQVHAQALRAQRDTLVTTALGPAPVDLPLPSELRLAAELRSLRQTRRLGERVPVAYDATDRLVNLLARWPAELPTRTEAIVITDASVHVRGLVAASETAQQLASATSELPGLLAGFPAIQSGPDGCRFVLEWRRAQGVKR